ncbi:LLM class F420-dependent oxidoreductase [Candidatus Nephthysia bennettiae]|uniref:LLM class F420-dependent oxidoreductase n=1 Tax=Candidatus Nephthysia bennettiae TaxID=3127016 RepID=A0A934K879_9BACT|nr:LLM class F420-dependent oxidoreductase [Candidatus Dormibacteraeota bacterium]MBJ7612952.1 LLM class F420-dependent oxidoreductase [Candidatus Dormibacteraeota bacterium]
MKIGLQIPDFTWPDGPERMGSNLAAVARAADECGFDSVGVMDHLFQIGMVGPPQREMLEAYTTLGFLAGNTSRAKLMAMVTGVVYRHPGVLAKAVTTLDVVSGGRAWLGIGAAWNDEEARGLGIPFPPLAERMERLEETIQICLQMWRGEETPYAGRHYRLERPLNSPQALSRPHPPILIGGSGERKTLRLVARYAQACNLFPTPQLPHKLEVLKAHCEAEGRDYDEIEKTCMFSFDVGEQGEKTGKVLGQLRWLSGMGVQTVIGSVKDVWRITPLEVMGREVIPAAAEL